MSQEGEGVVPVAAIAGISLASILVPLNSTMIAVALPDIASDFDISTGQTSVLVTVYLAAMLVGQPLSGRVIDRLGARPVAIGTSVGFGVISAGAMLAGSFWLLVGCRAVQAAFAAALGPSVQAMLRQLVPPSQRGRAFGLQGSLIGVGAGLGPVIGGLVVAAFGWRAVFGVNLPVVVLVLVVLSRQATLVEETVRSGDDAATEDVEPLFNRVFRAAFATQALSNLAQYALLLAVPIVLDSRGWSAAWTGISLSCLTLGLVVTGPYGGHLGDSLGRRRPVLLGLSLSLAAVLASTLGGDDVPSAVLVTTLLLFGVGLGVATPSVTTAGIESAPLERTGAAAGVLSASRYVGSIASTFVLAGFLEDTGEGLSVLLAVCSVSVALALVAARQLPRRVEDPVVISP